MLLSPSVMALKLYRTFWLNGPFSRDYKASAEFYERVLGLIPLHDDPARKSKFYWIGAPGEAMFGIRENYPSPLVQRQHFAFRVALDDLEAACRTLQERGVETSFGGRETQGSRAGWE